MSALLAQSHSHRHRSRLTPDLPETLDGATSDKADLDFLAFIPGTAGNSQIRRFGILIVRFAPEAAVP
jgi:hypothetical protein